MDWNHWLDVQEVNLVVVLWPGSEVEVILKRHTDEISHRILRLPHKICVFVFLFVGFLWFRSLRGQRHEQKKNDHQPEKLAWFNHGRPRSASDKDRLLLTKSREPVVLDFGPIRSEIQQ